MTLVSNDPSWWPFIVSTRISSYIVVASSALVMYDWALTFGQEIELVWKQHCSLMTVLYLSVRYAGIFQAAVQFLTNIPTIFGTDVDCLVMYVAATWIIFVANAILAVIMIARLYAMYQGSRKVLMILIAIFLTVYIAVGLVSGISEGHSSIKELILSGTHQYILQEEERSLVLMILVVCILTMCEVIALCFALWIAVKRCRELRRYSAGGFVEGFLGALMKSHIIHFASFVVMSCFQLGLLSHRITGDPYFLEYRVYSGLSQTFSLLQLFVLGPRLIIDVREYHAKLIADSDAPIGMTSIAFRERVHVSTSSTV